MTQLPFEDLPEKADKPVNRFVEFWSHAIRKVGKLDAAKAYSAALRQGYDEDVIMAAWVAFNKRALGRCRIVPVHKQFVPYPATWIRGGYWMDEDDTPKSTSRYGPKSDFALRQIAEYVKKPFYEFGAYPRETLQACVDAGLLTVEQMEEKL